MLNIPFNTLKPGCPFRLEIQTNVSFKEVHPDSSVTSLNLQVFLISLKLRTPIHRLDSGRLSPFTHVSPLENPSLGSNGRLSPNLSKLINTMNYSIFDISIFKPSKETNSYDYDLSLLVNPLKAIPIAPYLSGLIPVANPIYLYINHTNYKDNS